jgi:hypothetical protein
VQDVPTRCRENSRENLVALLELPHVCNSTTRLAIESSRSLTRDGIWDHHWLDLQLPVVLVSIIQKAPRLLSLVYTFERMRMQRNSRLTLFHEVVIPFDYVIFRVNFAW